MFYFLEKGGFRCRQLNILLWLETLPHKGGFFFIIQAKIFRKALQEIAICVKVGKDDCETFFCFTKKEGVFMLPEEFRQLLAEKGIELTKPTDDTI